MQFDKIRDPSTGKITSIECPEEDLTGKTAIVFDDICDGGGTFLGIAKRLDELGAKNKILVVTHGIFSKGLDIMFDAYDEIITTNSFPQTDDRLEVIDVMDLRRLQK